MIVTQTATIDVTDGIVVVRVAEHVVQTIAQASENLDAAISLSGPRKRPLLVDLRKAQPLSPAVRHHYSGQVLVDSFSAMALLVDGSPLRSMMGNVYLRIARPGIPSRLFTDESTTVAWLKGFA